jgi:hypothetical protein
MLNWVFGAQKEKKSKYRVKFVFLRMGQYGYHGSFKSYSMDPKFDELNQRYIILIQRYAA